MREIYPDDLESPDEIYEEKQITKYRLLWLDDSDADDEEWHCIDKRIGGILYKTMCGEELWAESITKTKTEIPDNISQCCKKYTMRKVTEL